MAKCSKIYHLNIIDVAKDEPLFYQECLTLFDANYDLARIDSFVHTIDNYSSAKHNV